MDPVKNFAITTVATAPSPADSGTSLVVATGTGSLFPNPSTDGEFNVVIFPQGEQPITSNAEIVRVTDISSDTLTIDRGQEGSSYRSILEGDIVMLGFTKKSYDEIKAHLVNTDNPHGVTATQVGLSNVTNDAQIPLSQKGAASGVAELDEGGLVPTSQLPSYVDDVLEYANTTGFPETGETGKIYVALDTNKTYRWSGSAYTEISASLALGETSATAYRGDRGKTAYDHSQLTSGNPHGVTASDIGVESGADVTDAGNVGSSIHGATEKTSIADNDEFAQIDSAASNVLKRITWTNIKTAIKSALATWKEFITGQTEKTSVADNDLFLISDSADTSALKKVKWSNMGVGKNVFQSDSTNTTNTTKGVLAGLVNGSNTVYTVSLSKYISGTLEVKLNGQVLVQGVDYTETTPASGTFTMTTAPVATDVIEVFYQSVVTTTGNADTLDNLHASSFLKIDEIDMCHIQKNGSGSHQTISNSTSTALSFDQELFDTNTMHDNSTNNSRVTIKRTGYYLINGAIRWETTSSGGYNRKISIYKNGSEVFTNIILPTTTSASNAPSQTITAMLLLAVNDYIELYVYQDSGGNLDVSKWSPHTYLEVVRMR